MASAVVMPKAGITVESCIIGCWEKKVGDPVAEGEVLFQYETDKAAFQCESTASGELLEIFFHEGDEVPCLTNVCAIGIKGEDCSALRPNGAAASQSPASQEEAAPAPAAEPQPEPAVTATAGGPASPRARRLAQRAGVDLSLAIPTGPKGRILERDVRKLMVEPYIPSDAGIPAQIPPVVPTETPKALSDHYTDVSLSGIRKAIVKSMMGSLHGSAQLSHNFSFDAGEIKSYREKMKRAGGDYAGITLGDMVLYVVSRVLLDYPDLNAHMLNDHTIRHFHSVNLSVAVDTPRGLIVPVIRDAQSKSLLEISREMKVLAQEAISGAISPDKLTGGTFTVSNLGSFGVESFTPILNPPQTGIIGVCKLVERPRTGADGSLELYPSMGLSLTYDHRAIDGAPASRFMQEVCRRLEQFTTILAG